jgi:hypothetical protein
MMKSWTLALMALVAVGAAALVANASPTRAANDIEWTDLVPKGEPIVDPLAKLNQDQRFDLEMILWARSLSAAERELEPNRPGVEDAQKYEQNFAKAGIDINQLLTDYKAFEEKIKERQKLVNNDLAGKDVRLAGYLLPLEFSETGDTDFLLVPYVGACVHVPPPPPNQIVFVRLAEKFIAKDLFTPVWVQGPLKTKQSSKALTLIDGTRDVSIGYHIDGAKVEVYKE